MRKPATEYDQASLIFSIDVDVGGQRLGEKNQGKNDRNVHDYLPETVVGKIEEQAVPLLLEVFNSLEVPATFAFRGQLTELDASVLDLVLKSPLKHDIGAHGYYHKSFTALSTVEADAELNMISEGMKKFGIEPKSFVFPRNRIAHLSLLEKWGYSCFRGRGDFLRDSMCVRKYRNLYDIHPGLYLGRCSNPIFLNRIVDIAVKHRATLHVWFHPWNLGNSLEAINAKTTKILLPFLEYARERQRSGILQFETMRSIAEKQRSLEH